MITHLHVSRRRLLTTRQAARILNVDEDGVAEFCELGYLRPCTTKPEVDPSFSEHEIVSLVERLRENRGNEMRSQA
jgi:hypothetical protein